MQSDGLPADATLPPEAPDGTQAEGTDGDHPSRVRGGWSRIRSEVRGASDVARGTDESEPVRGGSRRSGKVRKARLRVIRVDPWSVSKTAFVLSTALGIASVVAVAVIWSVVDAAGVFDTLGTVVNDVTSTQKTSGVDLSTVISLSRVVGLATLLMIANCVLITALATLGAFLYNFAAGLIGGFELTLAEDE